ADATGEADLLAAAILGVSHQRTEEARQGRLMQAHAKLADAAVGGRVVRISIESGEKLPARALQVAKLLEDHPQVVPVGNTLGIEADRLLQQVGRPAKVCSLTRVVQGGCEGRHVFRVS